MTVTLTIPGRLPSLNDYIAAERANRFRAAKMKRDCEELILWCVKQQLKNIAFFEPVSMRYTWYEKDKKRDHDNVSSFGRKVIQDALVKSGVLRDDGWDEISNFSDEFVLDKKNPRIEVVICIGGEEHA